MKKLSLQKNSEAGKLMPVFVLLAVCMLVPAVANAADLLPWETPLDTILKSLNGPVAKIIGTICVITTGLALAFGEMGGAARKGIQIVFGLSIAYFATTFISNLFQR